MNSVNLNVEYLPITPFFIALTMPFKMNEVRFTILRSLDGRLLRRLLPPQQLMRVLYNGQVLLCQLLNVVNLELTDTH